MTDSIPSIDEEFAHSLPDDPRRALLKIVETFEELRAAAGKGQLTYRERLAYLTPYLSLYALSRL
jgi:hypothetical protein